MKVESILQTTVRVQALLGRRVLTNATGFFFERGARLFLVTCRHVLVDEASGHHPDRIEIEMHAGDERSFRATSVSIPLFERHLSTWRTCSDAGGDVDVAVVELPRDALPRDAFYRAFSSSHIALQPSAIEVGQPVLVVGFPLGFQDRLHRLPVVRQAAIASSFGLRFNGQGYFLTDARTHRGTSGAPVVLRSAAGLGDRAGLPWLLLGVHSARLESETRDVALDEVLGLNCAWYADVLSILTEDRALGP